MHVHRFGENGLERTLTARERHVDHLKLFFSGKISGNQLIVAAGAAARIADLARVRSRVIDELRK